MLKKTERAKSECGNRAKAASIAIGMLSAAGCQAPDASKAAGPEEIQSRGVLKVGTTGD